jgi:putative ABC transport system permease protein
VLAARPPAREAAGWPPRGAGEEAGLARQAVRRAPQFALLGVACMLAAGLLTLMAGLVPVFAGIFLFILGAALATPWLVGRVLDLLQRGRVGGLAGRLALAEARGGLDRMGVAAAALAVAVAAGLGVGLMVNSFRSTVADWLGQTLNGDLYVSADGGRALPPAFVRQVGALPGLDALHTGIRTRVDAAGGPVDVLAIGTPSGAHPAARLKSGQPDAWSRWQAGAVLISEPLSRRRHLAPGDTLRLRTAQGWRAFPIVGVYYDYNPGPGRVLMARAAYARYWRDDRVLTLGLYLRHGVTLQAMQERLRTLAARDGLALDVRSNRAILANALHTFDQTFAVTRALRLLVLLVAFAGVFSGLMALLLERSRVHATLRALGLTPAGVFGLLIGEAALIGLCAGLIALPLGAALAWALVELVNPRAFGWSLLLHFQAPLFGQTLLLALGGALLASLYPALRLARTPPARALRSA